jgi:hypothetical protein
MDMQDPSAGNSPGKPGPIPFSMNWPDQALEGTIAIRPCVGNQHVIALELHLAGKRLGSAALTEEGALDLALRLVGTIMNRRRAARGRTPAPRSNICSLEVAARDQSP